MKKFLVFVFMGLFLAISFSLNGDGEVKEEPKQESEYKFDGETVTTIIEDTLGEKTNEDTKRIVDLQITEENYLFITLKAGRIFKANTVLADSSILLNELQKIEGIEQVNITWLDDSIDIFGNLKEIEIVKIGFQKSTFYEINFKKFEIRNYKKLAAPYYIHPEWDFK